MPGRYDEPELDEWDEDPEGPQLCDLTDDDQEETPTVPCPSCRRPIPDFVDRCPYCGDWLVQSAGTSSPRPWLFVVVLILIAALLAWVVF
jgi:hypothetical protein